MRFPLVLCFLLALQQSQATLTIGYVSYGPLKVQIVDDFSQIPQVNLAWGYFNDTISTLGWATLEIHAGGVLSDRMDMEAAGFLEGYLTAPRIAQNFRNRWNITAWSSNPTLMNFVEKNDEFIGARLTDPPVGEEAYWRQVGLLNSQLTGLAEGYLAGKLSTDAPYSRSDFYLANLHDDVDDILTSLSVSEQEDTIREPHFDMGPGGCSAFVKVVPNDVYISQITWTTFQTMLRVFKKYNFNVAQTDTPGSPLVAATKMSFGGYFGLLSCGDDYYQMNPSLLVTQETTNDVGDTSLFRKYVTPETVSEWIRTLVANRLADSAADWVRIFSLYNSGTYNNQWMALDYGLLQQHFEQGHDTSTLPDGLLWVAEQIPGTIASADVTSHLQTHGYWASYNIPYFPEIYNVSGYPQWFAQYGDFFSYTNCPRAKIFARDGPKVQTMADMQRIMRYNRFQTDPLSACACTPPYSAENSIAARSDLNPANGTYPLTAMGHRAHGATDAKMTNLKWALNGTTLAIVGPTYDDQPPFQWSTSDFNNVAHEGLPDRFEFDWQLIGWISISEHP